MNCQKFDLKVKSQICRYGDLIFLFFFLCINMVKCQVVLLESIVNVCTLLCIMVFIAFNNLKIMYFKYCCIVDLEKKSSV